MIKKSVITLAMLSTSSVASAIELTDFVEPNTKFDEAFLDFSATANDGAQDQASYSAFLDGFYDYRNSTQRRVFSLNVDGNVSASRGSTEGASSIVDNAFSISGSTDVYFSQARPKLFYFGEGTYAYRKTAIDDNISFTIGLGYGRVYNATSLAKALQIQNTLNENELLSSDLSDEALLNLAAIIAREDEFRAEMGEDDYKGDWYTAMEQTMADAGVLDGGELSALGTFRIDDVLFNETISARRHGWLVRIGAGFQASDFSGISDNDPKILIQGEYAKPFGLTSQLLNVTTYEPVFGDNSVHTLNNAFSYSYELSDTVDWINTWDLTVQQATDDDDTRFITNRIASNFLFEISNALDLGLTLSATQTDLDPDPDNTTSDDVEVAAILGLRYRLK